MTTTTEQLPTIKTARRSYVRATQAERFAYRSMDPKPTYPLAGWVTIHGVRCAVEDLGEWSKGNPQYEIISPRGHHFHDGDTLHTLLCTNVADVNARAYGVDVIERCGEPNCTEDPNEKYGIELTLPTKKLTVADARAQLTAIDMTLSKRDGEYRVTFKNVDRARAESAAYYTNDLEDALATGKMMRQHAA